MTSSNEEGILVRAYLVGLVADARMLKTLATAPGAQEKDRTLFRYARGMAVDLGRLLGDGTVAERIDAP